ncbi:pentatricopeptide repeat-containing protein At4g32450, mitochondrial-like [Chenopodium quinoa]|uniref:DYW domain-containing protein n=1 Tax=Chenopodium quinoa TaxID=63459 RepID=A0A803LAU6_CHEQI|nr:pentatricopeptide repeat-containing protein At4g32450, mitochondrial-like [Chenopodium quinoa]
MNRYWPLFSKFRRFHNRYCNSHIRWRNDIASCQGRSREDAAFCLRQYSSLGVNMVRESSEDIHSDGMYGTPENHNDFYKLGDSSPRGGNVNYRQNVGHFQHLSSPMNHYVTNEWTTSQNIGHPMTEKIEVGLQHPGYSNGGENAAFQPISNHQTMSNGQYQQNPSNVYMVNGVASPPGGYQQERVDTRSNLNSYHQVNAGGYHNTHLGPHQQKFNGSRNPNILPQQQVSATHHGQLSAGNDELDEDNDVEGTLEELDVFCEEWDLEHAVKSMRKLSKRGVFIDMPRYLILIDACGKGKALKEAQDVHQNIVKYTSPVKVSVFNRILEMYGKCGSMDDAYNTFNSMPERNLTSWDTMITWFAKNGLGEDAIDMFTKFKEAGLKPDGQMFLGIFDACGVLGDATEGMLHFDSMTKIHGITPTMVHYASIVHMFGSAGDLDGALDFIEKMPVQPNAVIWESLMNIARVQGNIEIGDHCAQIVEQLDPARLSKELKDGLLPVNDSDTPKKKVKKYNPLAHTKHEYRAGDRTHPENDKIYKVLRGIKESVKEAGYVAETKFVLHDIDQESKEEAIMAHSERLACTYALLTNPARMPLRIIKNLRVCGDCHNYFKIISKLVGREIIMRDAKRFHHFKDGKCSCNDYW